MRRSLILCLVLAAACSDPDDGGEVVGTGSGSQNDGGDGGVDGGTPVDAAPVVGEPANLVGITAAHNAVRAAVSTSTPLPPVTWSNQLAATAQAWASQCIDTENPRGLVDHSDGATRSAGFPYAVGENIFGSSGTATAQGTVNSWASEKSNYNYANNSCSGICGHYTQIVWRTTREIGCALVDCPGLQYGSTVVCNYGPAGNYSGQLPY